MQDKPSIPVLSAACFAPDASIETILSRVEGYSGLELVLWERAGALRVKTSTSELARLRAAASVLPDGVVNVHIELPDGVHLARAEEDARERAIEFIEKAIGIASAIGARSVSVAPAMIGPWPDGDYCEALRVVCLALRELARVAERAGVEIGFIPVSGGFLLSPAETRDLVDEVNSPHVGVVLDVTAVERVGVVEQWVNALGRRVIAIRGDAKDVRFEGVRIELGRGIENGSDSDFV